MWLVLAAGETVTEVGEWEVGPRGEILTFPDTPTTQGLSLIGVSTQ